MKFLDSDIALYQQKLDQLKQAQAEIEALGLVPGLPAINRSKKAIVLLKNQVEVSSRKNKETGVTVSVTKIVGFDETGQGNWIEITDLIAYSDASRILYLA